MIKLVPASDVTVITNSVMYALGIFRIKEALPEPFVYKWLCKLCPSVSQDKMRNKVTVTLKKLKDLKNRKKSSDLDKLLSDTIILPDVSGAESL